MRIAVVGAGGVGGYFGGRLARHGADVTFFVRGPTRDALRERGLRVDSIAGDFVLPRVDVDPAGTYDAIFVAVKAWQLEDAARALLPFIGADTVVVPLENGMEAPQQLAAIVGKARVLGGLCGIVSFIVAPGHIRHAGADPFVMFGELDRSLSERVTRLRDFLVAHGVNASVPPDIHHSMWTKFLFIAPMSAIGAATRVPVGVWRAMPETRELAIAMLRELIAVATAHGVALGDDALERTLARYDALPAESTSS
ncbi:MAG TPA: 2-dehydropantoate 2-reductase, partial [Thermoanaerobaculia bacterium]